MRSLADNIYNKSRRQDQKKFKLWKYAGLMLTYKCSAACRFCYYNCGPDKAGLLPVSTAISAWKSLESLAGPLASVHITGGEPFLYYDHLCDIMAAARENGLKPPDSIETNASWATDANLVTERLKALDALGMRNIKISWDPFHAEFIDPASVILLRDIASEVLGEDRVMVRWEKYLQQPVKTLDSTTESEQQLFVSAINDEPCRFTGRAAHALADMAEQKPIEQIARQTCLNSYRSAKGVHIDPYGNVFSGLCSGIILGNINSMTLEDIWINFDPAENDFIAKLCSNGPSTMLAEACSNGYKSAPAYAGKCHLCTDIRQFFFDIGKYKPIIGPCDCYLPLRVINVREGNHNL